MIAIISVHLLPSRQFDGLNHARLRSRFGKIGLSFSLLKRLLQIFDKYNICINAPFRNSNGLVTRLRARTIIFEFKTTKSVEPVDTRRRPCWRFLFACLLAVDQMAGAVDLSTICRSSCV